jgi:hypothetical protein
MHIPLFIAQNQQTGLLYFFGKFTFSNHDLNKFSLPMDAQDRLSTATKTYLNDDQKVDQILLPNDWYKWIQRLDN